MSAPSLLLALHSSTERFGVAVLDPSVGELPQPAVFDDGRGLSNTLLKRVESVLPAPRWPGLQGLAVATGPGGFTGTRLTVVMARTLAQQLRVPLVGVSSFTFLLAVSCWAFSISYSPPVRVEGALQVPIVFDNGTDLVVAQASSDFADGAIAPTLDQIAANLRPGGRNREVRVRLRQLQAVSEGTSRPVVLGETKRDFSQG